jgi:hypothetical protein
VSTTRSAVSGAALVWLLCVTRAPEQRSAPASRSDSGPRPWMRIDAARLQVLLTGFRHRFVGHGWFLSGTSPPDCPHIVHAI